MGNSKSKAKGTDTDGYDFVLLGTGQSGKSTICHQLRKIYEDTQSKDIFGDSEECTNKIRRNTMAQERHTGEIKWFNITKGYGFILSMNGNDIFVHKSNVIGVSKERLLPGNIVEFSIVPSRKSKNKLQAIDVVLLKQNTNPIVHKQRSRSTLTSNLSIPDKHIFHIINNIVNLADISILIIEFYQPFKWDETTKHRNCIIDSNGHQMTCKGTTNQWEHVIGNAGGRYLEFKIRLDHINMGANIPKPIIANTAGGGYNGNGRVIAHGCQWFSGNNGNGFKFIKLRGERWKKGDIVSIIADAETSTICYQWKGFNQTIEFDKVSGDRSCCVYLVQ